MTGQVPLQESFGVVTALVHLDGFTVILNEIDSSAHGSLLSTPIRTSLQTRPSSSPYLHVLAAGRRLGYRQSLLA